TPKGGRREGAVIYEAGGGCSQRSDPRPGRRLRSAASTGVVGMVKLSWDAIRRALGIPEPAPGDARRGPKEAGGGGREGGQAAAWTGKPLDVELSAEVSVTPPPAGGRQVSITYSGRLAHEAAGEIYLHY